MIEVLVILQVLPEAARRAAAQRARTLCDVTATLGPRLLLGRVTPHGLAGLRALVGVQAVVEPTDDTSAMADACGLDDTERLFATAWAAQARPKGPRAGAGLDWDAPGFSPPDGPRR